MFTPKRDFKEVTPNFVKSTNNLTNIAPTKAKPGPVNTAPMPETIPLANLDPTESPWSKVEIFSIAPETVLKRSLAASAKPISPNIEENS